MIKWKSPKTLLIVAGCAVSGSGAGRHHPAILLAGLVHLFGQGRSITVSGNIEAHESVLGFKPVQSRIVGLPFDEGKNVKAGAVIAQVDNADYRQQVVIAEASLECAVNSTLRARTSSSRRSPSPAIKPIWR